MKSIALVLITLLNTMGFIPELPNQNSCEFEPFEVYTTSLDKPISVKNQPKGKIIFQINAIGSYGCVFHVIDMKEDWLKIDGVDDIDGVALTDFQGWIHSSFVEAAITYSVDLVSEPNGKRVVGQLTGEQDTYTIIDARCDWVKVKKDSLNGWMPTSYVCGSPVTTCP